MAQKSEIKETEVLSTIRGDVYKIDPRNIDIQEGLNGRTEFDREELEKLKASIKANGVQTPILVKKSPGTERFLLVNGERRLLMCLELVSEGHELRIPGTIFKGSAIDAVVSMLITNDNVALNLVEEAGVLNRLKNMGLTPKEIAARTGRKINVISTLLQLNEAPEKVKKLIKDKVVSPTLVMKVFREEKSFDSALEVIEKAVNNKVVSTPVTSSEEPNEGKVSAPAPKTKITEKDIKISKGKKSNNSISALKKALKQYDSLEVKDDKLELFEFLQDLMNDEFSFEDLMEELYVKPE